MLCKISFVLFLVLLHKTLAFYQNQSTIYHINGLRLQSIIREKKYVLTLFYSLTCPASKRYSTEYIFMSKVLKDLFKGELIITSIDAMQNLNTIRLYEIYRFPKMFLFIDGKWDVDFKELKPNKVINYLVMKLKQTPVDMQKLSTVQTVITKLKYVLVGFFKNRNSKEYNVFASFIKRNLDINWIIVSSSEIFKFFNVKNSSHMIIFRQYENPRIDYSGEYKLERVSRYFFAYSCPYIMKYENNDPGIPHAFIPNVTDYLIAFTDSTHKKYSLHKAILVKSAKHFMGTVRFVHTDLESGRSYYLKQIFDGKNDIEVPRYYFLRYNPNNTNMHIYRPTDRKMTSKRVVEFVINVLKGHIKPHVKSGKISQHWNKYPVKILVRDNYVDVTTNPNLTVFVQICHPLCPVCNKEQDLWYALALSYLDRPDVWIAIIDAEKNDIPNITISHFPLYQLYPKHSNKTIVYLGNRTIMNFLEFVESDGKINNATKFTPPEIEKAIKVLPAHISNEETKHTMSSDDLDVLLSHIKLVEKK